MSKRTIYPEEELIEAVESFIKQFKEETGVALSFNKAVLLLVERGLGKQC